MAVVRYLGMRDVEAHTSAVRDVIFVRGRCQRGHAIDAEVPQLLWGPDSYEAARVVVEALECKACRSI